MDVTLLNASVFGIPSARRVGALAHDGASDLRLWPGPSADRELNAAYGKGLQAALDRERRQMGVDELSLGEVARVHSGRLHCDFLAWVATRAPEPGAIRSPAPDLVTIERAVRSLLLFVAERSVRRIAIPALGAGPGDAPPAERVAAVVRAATRYEDWCFAEGRAPVVEEVLVCEQSSAILTAARRLVGGHVRAARPEAAPAADSPPKRRRRAAAPGSKRRTRKAAGPRLDPDEVARMRPTCDAYDRTRAYAAGDWFLHPKFGVGRVERNTPEGAIEVLFEDGALKKMIHARPD